MALEWVVEPNFYLFLWISACTWNFLKTDSKPVCLQLPALQALYSVKIVDEFLHL